MALRANRDPSLAGPLADLLAKPGMSGHAESAGYYRPRAQRPRPGRVPPRATTDRAADNLLNAKFREVLVAALLFDCGDRNRKGRTILEAYTKDVHGHFAAYATAALDGKLVLKETDRPRDHSRGE